METKHVFEEGIYLISNKSVAKCYLFKDTADCDRFKAKLNKYLEPIGEIHAFGFMDEEFEIVIKLKSRKVFESFFMNKTEELESTVEIPESTYIFAQLMANLQSSYAKWFNHKYKRDGGLFSGRYYRKLIESEEEFERTIERINAMNGRLKRLRIWTYRRKSDSHEDMEKRKRSEIWSSWKYYNSIKEESKEDTCFDISQSLELKFKNSDSTGVISKKRKVGNRDRVLKCFRVIEKKDLRGWFDKLPPKSLESPKLMAIFMNFVLNKKMRLS